MKEEKQGVKNLHELLDYNAAKFTSAEVQLKKVLNKWLNQTNSIKLNSSIRKYLEIVEEHIHKLENFFITEEITAISITNRVMQAMIEDTEEKLAICNDPDVRDACMLASIQSINHYKISTYGTAAAFANTLGMEEQAGIFHEAEVKEKQIDVRLSQLAEHEINLKAKAPPLLR